MSHDVAEAATVDPPSRDEAARLRALARYGGPDDVGEKDVGGSDRDFDDIVRLAALCCKTPLAAISFVGPDALWHKAEFGFGGKRRMERRHTFSRLVIERAELVVVQDARADPLLCTSPLVVADPHVRFCAGLPLLSDDGHAIGTLCVYDRAPGDLSDDAALALEALARQCVSHLELRRSLRIEREAEERLSLIFESATDYAILSLDQDGLIASWNAGARLIFGWTEAEALGRHVAFLFTPIDQRHGAPARDLGEAMQHGREIHERYYQRKNRSQFWGTGETMPLLSTSGATRGYLVILRDRTSQKRTKEALEYQTGILQTITDHIGEALFQVDVQHRVVFMNPAAEEMFGWSRYELLGVNLHDRLHHHHPDGTPFSPEDCPYVVALQSRASLPHRPDTFVHRDGRFLDVIVSFIPIVTDGRVTGAVMTLSDVTEQKQTEQALRRVQERYQLAVASSDIIGSWDWDLRARTVVSDATFAAQYGVDSGLAAEGAPIEAFVEAIHPEDRERVFAAIDDSIRKRSQFFGEYRLRGPDGSIRWVSAHARCQYDGLGRPVRFPGLSVDITARKRNEEYRAALLDLEDRLRAEERAAEITGLAATMLGELLGAYRAGFCAFDATGTFGTVERDFVRPGGVSLAGMHRMTDYGAYGAMVAAGELITVDDIERDERMAAERPRWRSLNVGAVVIAPLMAGGRLAAVFFVHAAKPRAWSEDDIALIRNVSDRTWAALTRADGARRQKILTGELHHRIKNTMTMVQAIARQTMRKAQTKEEAHAAFERRLMALSAAQDVLTRSSWSAATMAQIIAGALEPHRPEDVDRIRVDGPDTNLSPQSALSFVLAFHELATNATKYGALSNDSGFVTIHWSVEDRAGSPIFACEWREFGGPPVTPPTEKGFGTRLIKAGFAKTVKVELDYAPDGFRCRFEAPFAAL